MSVWPLFELTIQTPRIVLRYPTDDLLPGLTAAAAAGIHPPEDMPFSIPWTRKPPGEFERGICQFVWSRRATHTVDNWGLPFIVVEKGTPIGIQERSATNYPTVRTVETGSWLTNRAQGRGIGKEMRAAVLHLAFAGLGATAAIRASFVDNPKSEAVSRALGYHPNGSTIIDREHQPVRMNRWTLPRETWEANRRDDIDITGLDTCLPLLNRTSSDRLE